MPPSQPITVTVIVHLKEGVNLENVASGAGASGSPAVQAFVQLTNILKAQQGFMCQFWGHQVENPNIFVWSIDWESFEHHAAFIHAEKYNSLMADFGQVFDLKAAAPLTTYTRWTSDAAVALKAPVTEVSFFTLTNGASEEAKTAIEDALKPILQAVKTVGKAWGSAIGWSFEVMPHAVAVPQPGEEWLHGVFGYASIDDHMKWREQPEHGKAIEIFEDLDRRNLSLRPASVPGIDPSTGYFHVKFRSGM